MMSSESPNQSLSKYLKYLSHHRGTKENDIILGIFWDQVGCHFSDDQKNLYKEFLQEKDSDIYSWVMDQTFPPQNYVYFIDQIKKLINKRG